jgi:hypothetical protein
MERLKAHNERDEYHSALICAVLCNINRDPKKSKTFTPQDFMPSKAKPEAKQTPEQMLNAVKGWQALYEAKK